MFQKLLKTITDQKVSRGGLKRAFMRKEAVIGGTVFGPVPNGVRREFFCLDEHTWIWHEEWTDVNGVRRTRTTRYDVRPGGVLKAQDGQDYKKATDEEAYNLYEAAKIYQQRVGHEVYGFLNNA